MELIRLGWREAYYISLPKTVSSQQDHSLKECHPKWVSQPQMAGKDSARSVLVRMKEKRNEMMIEW